MTQQDKQKFYKMMVLFSHGTKQTKERLIRNFGSELVDEAIKKQYIQFSCKDQFGLSIYEITKAGKEVWL